MPTSSPDPTRAMEQNGQPSWRVGRLLGSSPPSTTDTAFLQQRLATLGKVMFIVAMSGVCLRAVGESIKFGPGQLLQALYY